MYIHTYVKQVTTTSTAALMNSDAQRQVTVITQIHCTMSTTAPLSFEGASQSQLLGLF